RFKRKPTRLHRRQRASHWGSERVGNPMRFLSLNTPESVARTLHDGLLSGRIVLRRDLPRTRKKAMLSNLETGEMQPDSPLVDIARTQKRAILPNLETLKSRFQ